MTSIYLFGNKYINCKFSFGITYFFKCKICIQYISMHCNILHKRILCFVLFTSFALQLHLYKNLTRSFRFLSFMSSLFTFYILLLRCDYMLQSMNLCIVLLGSWNQNFFKVFPKNRNILIRFLIFLPFYSTHENYLKVIYHKRTTML